VLRRLLGASRRRPGRRIADAGVGPVISNMARTKVLLVATTPSSIDKFNRRNMSILRELGCAVHVASNFASVGGSSFWAEARRAEMLLHGQEQVPGWLGARADIVTPAAWQCLASACAARSAGSGR
jgi:hypothetical protein